MRSAGYSRVSFVGNLVVGKVLCRQAHMLVMRNDEVLCDGPRIGGRPPRSQISVTAEESPRSAGGPVVGYGEPRNQVTHSPDGLQLSGLGCGRERLVIIHSGVEVARLL